MQQGQLPEAVVAYGKAIAIEPSYAEAHCNQGDALTRMGQFAPALAAYQRGHELGRQRPDWRFPSDVWVRDAQRRVELDRQLPAFLRGDRQPKGADEQLELARLCRSKRLYVSAVRFYNDAFAAQPALGASHRYDAACYAALASAGQGEDAAGSDDQKRARLRRQALDWLRADLALWVKRSDGGQANDRAAMRQMLRHWRADPDLRRVRHPWALWRLPDEERRAWRGLWADVEALLRKAEANK
jgi:tetratricopeptide (TPR) repeat protein